MISKLKKWFKDHGTEVLVVISVLFLLIYAVFRISKRGTYTPLSYYKYFKEIPAARSSGGSPGRRGPVASKSEVRTRQVLEEYFGRPFNKARPDFLRNPVTGNSFNLELDCYNPELGLAVEYNGIQHYKFTPFFHRNKEAFLNQKYRDDMKRRMCRERGVVLIEIPYTVKYEELRGDILDRLRRRGF